jgi:hypothetical protein
MLPRRAIVRRFIKPTQKNYKRPEKERKKRQERSERMANPKPN